MHRLISDYPKHQGKNNTTPKPYIDFPSDSMHRLVSDYLEHQDFKGGQQLSE